jgi:hypothetical protein
MKKLLFILFLPLMLFAQRQYPPIVLEAKTRILNNWLSVDSLLSANSLRIGPLDTTVQGTQSRFARIDSAKISGDTLVIYSGGKTLRAYSSVPLDSTFMASREFVRLKTDTLFHDSDTSAVPGLASKEFVRLYFPNVSDTSKYIEFADTSAKMASREFVRLYFPNIADTSKYVEYPDTTVSIATYEYVRTHSSSVPTHAQVRDSSSLGTNVNLGTYSANTNTTGVRNVAIGDSALYSNSIGTDNVAVGYDALRYSVSSFSVAIGPYALQTLNAIGTANTAVGSQAGQHLLNGTGNSIFGNTAMQATQSGNNNTAISDGSLQNMAGNSNTAIGTATLNNAQGGTGNTVVGFGAEQITNSSSLNYTTAVGFRSLYNNGTGYNVALGGHSALTNTSGSHLVAIGDSALYFNTTASDNTVLGYNGGVGLSGVANFHSITDNHMTFLGSGSSRDSTTHNTTPLSYGTAIGAGSRVKTGNKVALGRVDGSDTVDVYGNIRIGNGSLIAKVISASLVYDCGSIAAGVDSTFSVTCTEAVAGNPVSIGVSVAAEAGLIITAECTTNDVVTVRISNHMLISAVDPASRTYKVMVTNF